MSTKSKLKAGCRKKNMDFKFIWNLWSRLNKEAREGIFKQLEIKEK